MGLRSPVISVKSTMSRSVTVRVLEALAPTSGVFMPEASATFLPRAFPGDSAPVETRKSRGRCASHRGRTHRQPAGASRRTETHMHELTKLLAKARAGEIERTSRHGAERPRTPEGLRPRSLWRRVR